MAWKRRWLRPLAALVAFTSLTSVPAWAACGGGGGGLKPNEAELLADFLILAVKPEGDTKDYKLVEIGDTKINAGLLGVVVNTLPLGFLGIGGDDSEHTYDEAAEISQCRAACSANRECRDFTYVRPNASQPVGVCHLKRVTENASYGVMTPVRGPGEGTIIRPPAETSTQTETQQPTADKIVFGDTEKTGVARFGDDNARTTPVTLKFLAPVARVNVFLRATGEGEGRTFASVEALNAKGKHIQQAGSWISSGKFAFVQGVTVAADGDRIAVVKITARDGMLALASVAYTRELIAPPATPPDTSVIAETSGSETPVTPPREEIPRPPRLPPITVERTPLPPRVVVEQPTAPPRVIVATPPPFAEVPSLPAPVVAPPPLSTPAAIEPAPPPEPAPVAVPAAPPIVIAAPERARRGLPAWAVVAAIAFMLGGATTYWHSHRRRMLARIATHLVSDGFDRHVVTVETAERPDLSLRFVVRVGAGVSSPATRIDLIPAGVAA